MAAQPVYKSYERFADSETIRQGARPSQVDDIPRAAAFRTIDISSTGSVHHSFLLLTQEEERKTENSKYWARLEAERRALKGEAKDIKTRLVLFNRYSDWCDFVLDLYGLEFRIEPSFFRACQNYPTELDHKPLSFLEEHPPAFLDLGRGWCGKIIDRTFDHPLIRGGMTIST